MSGSLFVENSFKTLGEQASPAVPALSNLLQVPDQGTRLIASRALAYIGKDGIPPLVAILTNRQALHRDEICYAFALLAATNFAPALPIIGACLRDTDPRVAEAAQWTLSDQTLHSLDTALAVITNADYASLLGLRTCAVMSLADNGLDSPEAAVPPLVRALEDPDPDVRRQATNGVKRIAPEVLKPNRRKRTNGPRPPGSVEDLLLSWSKQARSGLNGAFFDPKAMKGPDAPALQIILRGLGAVPDLIELLDDRRPTARRYDTTKGQSSRLLRVGELAALLLTDITGLEMAGLGGDASPYERWVEEARKVGEEVTVARALYERKDGQISYVRPVPAFILSRRFPERLRRLCEEFTDAASPDTHPHPLPEAVAAAQLPLSNRVDVLVECGRKGSLVQQREWLSELAKLDERKCAEILMSIWRNPPVQVGQTRYTCAEAAFAYVVPLVTDTGIWRHYFRIARDGTAAQKLQMVDGMWTSESHQADRTRLLRLAFLSAFLDDEDAAVRHSVAVRLAYVLGLPNESKENWTEKQWG
ncbi:MAG: HEAT repeat domain-containing protein, partial [Limisphaerales bacterium]